MTNQQPSQVKKSIIAVSATILVLFLVAANINPPEVLADAGSGGDKEASVEWYDDFLFKDKSFSTQLARALAWTYVQSADIGEVVSTARKITDGDIYSWHEEWLKQAERVYGLAEEWEKEGHAVSAGEAFFRATTYFQSAGFFMVAPKDRTKAAYCRKRGRESFLKAIKSYPNISFVEIPYENTNLPAYIARSDKVSGEGPLVIVNTGFDGTAEDSFAGVAWAAMKRGYHCLIFEGPGQGELIMEENLHFRPDWEVVGKAVIDYALTLPFVDKDRLAYMGVSMGGYLAPRVAGHDKRIKALIANGGLYRLWESAYAMFPPDQQELIQKDPAKFNAIVEEMKQGDVSASWLFDNSLWRFGVKDPAGFMVDQKRYTLESVAEKITCPTLVTDSVADAMFAGQPQSLYNALNCPKELIVFTRDEAAQAHCQLGASAISNEKIFNWLDGVFQPAPKEAMFKIHHLGIVVGDLDEAVANYCNILGIDPTDERIERFQGKENKTAILPVGSDEDYNFFELMEPETDHWMDDYIKRERLQGFFHLAVLIDDWEAKVQELKAQGFTLQVEEYENPFPGCKLLREAYVLPKDPSRGVLIDLMDAETFPQSKGGLAPAD